MDEVKKHEVRLEMVFTAIESLTRRDETNASNWNDVVEVLKNLDDEAIEEIVNDLIYRGRIFEPLLGRLVPA